MDGYKVVKYSSLYYDGWNDFVLSAKNSTFLFHRNFMEYHSHKFEDFSLLVYHNQKLIAVFPANINEGVVYSHQGLSYGGLILPHKITFKAVLETLNKLLIYLSAKNINRLIVKMLPKIYHLRSSDEMDYLLFILKAKLIRRDISMVIFLRNKMEYATLRKRQLKKGLNNEMHFAIEDDMSSFWNEVLIPNIKNTYGVLPVHSLTEISTLKEKFPNQIKQYNVYCKNELLAGCTIFETDNVAHVQYISAKKENNIGAIDYLINQLITKVYKGKEYFDFGISNENQGQNINTGLLNWKQGFGASPIIHDFYEVDVNNYSLLNAVMI